MLQKSRDLLTKYKYNIFYKSAVLLIKLIRGLKIAVFNLYKYFPEGL